MIRSDVRSSRKWRGTASGLSLIPMIGDEKRLERDLEPQAFVDSVCVYISFQLKNIKPIQNLNVVVTAFTGRRSFFSHIVCLSRNKHPSHATTINFLQALEHAV